MNLTQLFESDMSGVMHAARHHNKSFIITANVDGAKKKFRVNHQTADLAKDKFLQHHSMAKILNVQEEGVAEAGYRRDAYQRDYDNSVSGMGRRNSYAYSQDGGGNDERHDLDPSEWYIVKDGKMYKVTVYPSQEQEAISRGYSRTRDEAKAKAGQQGVTEGERTMSRAAKGYEKYGKAGMQALAKAGREGKDLDKIRDKYNKYDESVEQGVSEGSQRVDSLVTDALRIMQGSEASDAVAALKTVLGNREYNGRRGYYNFYVRQLMDMYGQQGVAGGLNEFAPGSGGGESGRWYTDDQMTDIVGDGWWEDMDVSGNISKQQMIQQAQTWLDDQGYSVQVLNAKLNDDDMDWYIEGNFHNPGFAKKGVAEGSEQDAKFTPRPEIRSRIETQLDQYLDPEKVAGAYTDVQYYKHDSRVYVEVLFHYTDRQKIGPKQRKRFLVNKDFTLTPIKGQGVAEGYNAEYDDEAGMADNNLETLKRAVQGLDNVITAGDNLPEWCQEKIAVSKSMLVSVWDYMLSEKEKN